MKAEMTHAQRVHETKRNKGEVKVQYTHRDTIVVLLDGGSPQVSIYNPTREELTLLSKYFNGGTIPQSLRHRMNFQAIVSLGRMKSNSDSYRRMDWRTGLAALARTSILCNPNKKGPNMLIAFLVKEPSSQKQRIKVSLKYGDHLWEEKRITFEQAWDMGHRILKALHTMKDHAQIQKNLDANTDPEVIEGRFQHNWIGGEISRTITEFEVSEYSKLTFALLRAAANTSGNLSWQEEVAELQSGGIYAR